MKTRYGLFLFHRKNNRVVPIKKRNNTVTQPGAKNHKRSAFMFVTQPGKTEVNVQMTSRTFQQAAATSSKTRNTSFASNVSSSGSNNQSNACLSGRTRESRVSDTSLLQTESLSSVSQVSLDNDQASMENNASSKSRQSTTSDLEGSALSDLGDSRGSRDRQGSDDYLDNFPYAPPNRKPIPRITTSIWSMRHK